MRARSHITWRAVNAATRVIDVKHTGNTRSCESSPLRLATQTVESTLIDVTMYSTDQLKDQQRILNIMTKAHIYNSRSLNGFMLPMRWSILRMIIQVQPRKVTLSLTQCHHPFLNCCPSVLPSRYLFSFTISPSYILKVFLAFSVIWLDYDFLLQSGINSFKDFDC